MYFIFILLWLILNVLCILLILIICGYLLFSLLLFLHGNFSVNYIACIFSLYPINDTLCATGLISFVSPFLLMSITKYRGLGGIEVRVLAFKLRGPSLNLGLGALCWKVGSLQCRILTNLYALVPAPVNWSQHDHGC